MKSDLQNIEDEKIHIIYMNYGSNDNVKPAPFVPEYLKGCDIAVLTEVRSAVEKNRLTMKYERRMITYENGI